MRLTRRSLLVGTAGLVTLTACGGGAAESGPGPAASRALSLSAIPDQDPEKLNRLYPAVAARMAGGTGLEVTTGRSPTTRPWCGASRSATCSWPGWAA